MPRKEDAQSMKPPTLRVVDDTANQEALAREAQFMELWDQGMTRPQVAETMGLSLSQVSGMAKRLGVSFTAAGNRRLAEIQIDNTERRTRLAKASLEAAERFLSATNSPYLVHGINKNGHPFTYKIPAPPSSDIKNLMIAFGISVQRSLELDRFDGDSSKDAKSLLRAIGGALGVAPYEPVDVA